jgi:hypothetical protein
MAFGRGDGWDLRGFAAAILGALMAMIRSQAKCRRTPDGGARGPMVAGAAPIEALARSPERVSLGMSHQLDRKGENARATGFGLAAQRIEVDLADFTHPCI